MAYQSPISLHDPFSGTRNAFSAKLEPWQQFAAITLDYEVHLGTKLDYIMYFNTQQLQSSEIQMLSQQCETERTQLLLILMLSLENSRLAGYILNGNRSMFLDTDGSVAWP